MRTITRRTRLARPLTSSARPGRRNRRDRSGDPDAKTVTVQWDERGTFTIVADPATFGGEPSVVTGELPEGTQLEDVVMVADPAGFTPWGFVWPSRPPRPPRPWVQRFPRRRGHGSRPGSGRSHRNR